MNSYGKELQFIKDKIRYSEDFEAFSTEIIGLKCKPFHKEWVNSFEKNRFNLLLAPRGHSKSYTVATYILWNIVKNPDIRILIVTINQDMANSTMSLIQNNLVQNTKLIDIFGEQKSNIEWSRDTLRVKKASPKKDPTLKVVGVTGGIVGGHYDIIILDDITDKENSRTETRRRTLEKQLDSEIMPMLENEPYGKLIVIGTIWNQADIYSYISKKPGYKYNKYRALLYEPEELYKFVTELNWHGLDVDEAKNIIKDYIKTLPDDKEPKVLWDWKVPYEELARIRKADGNVSFMMQYQNEFISDMDAPIKYDWIQSALSNYKVPERPYQTFMGVDLASKGEDSDYFTIVVIAIKDGLVYIIDGVRTKQLSMFGQFELIRDLDKKWNPSKIGVEQAAQGKIIVDQFMEMGTLPIIPIKSSIVNDKMSRIQRLSVLFETGRIFISGDEKFAPLIDELLSYPRGANEDFADGLSFAVIASQEFEDEGSKINWEEVASMTKDCSKKSDNVKSVGNRYNFTKIG